MFLWKFWMNFCREWGKDSNMNDIWSPLDEVIQKSVRFHSRSPTRVGRWSYYGFDKSASIGNRMRIPIPVCVDRRGFLSKNPPMRRSLIHCLSRGIFSASIHPAIWGKEGFSGTSESGIIIQISPHGICHSLGHRDHPCKYMQHHVPDAYYTAVWSHSWPSFYGWLLGVAQVACSN